MPFLNSSKPATKKAKKINTSPSKAEIDAARELGIDLGNKWNAYSKEVRLHIYVSNMDTMVKFYNQILDFKQNLSWKIWKRLLKCLIDNKEWTELLKISLKNYQTILRLNRQLLVLF